MQVFIVIPFHLKWTLISIANVSWVWLYIQLCAKNTAPDIDWLLESPHEFNLVDTIIIPFCRWGNWGIGRLRSMSKIGETVRIEWTPSWACIPDFWAVDLVIVTDFTFTGGSTAQPHSVLELGKAVEPGTSTLQDFLEKNSFTVVRIHLPIAQIAIKHLWCSTQDSQCPVQVEPLLVRKVHPTKMARLVGKGLLESSSLFPSPCYSLSDPARPASKWLRR
jgi:hypothetical protein